MKKFWKYRHELKGDHVHVTVFVSNHPAQTYANCGNLCMEKADWSDFQEKLDLYSSVKFEDWTAS